MEHYFNVEIAKEYGLVEAIIFCDLCRFVSMAKFSKDCIRYDGKNWIELKPSFFQMFYEYLSETQVKRAIKGLIFSELILKNGNLYTITDDGWEKFN